MRAALSALLLVACTGETPLDSARDTAPPVPAEEEDACRLRAQVGREVVPGQTPDTTAPAIPVGGEPATLAIVPDSPNYVRLLADQPGTFVIFASEVDVLMHVQEGVRIIDSPEPAPVAGCPDEVPERHDVEVGAAGDYHLRVAWAGFRTLWVYADLVPAD